MNEAQVKAIRDEISRLEDNIYRYEKLGCTGGDLAVAERLREKLAKLREGLDR